MKRLFVLCLLATACKDPHVDPNSDPDAAVTTDAAPAGPRAAVVSGEYMGAGILSDLDVDKLTVRKDLSPAGGVGSDPVLRRFGGKLYVVNRSGANNVSVYDAATSLFIEQYGTGPGSNPQDVAVVGNDMYVVGGSGLVKFHLGTGVKSGEIDLATAVGDPDGNPDCVAVERVGTKLYVACGLFDYSVFAPRGNGKVAIVDTANSDAVSAITLPSTNPQNFFVQTSPSSVFHGDLLIGLSPSYTDYSTGCIARVSTGTSPAATCADGLANSDIGGVLTHMDVSANGNVLWLAVNTNSSDFSVTTGTLRGFDLSSGSLWPDAISPSSQLVTDVAACPNGELVVIDRTMNAAGFRVYGTDYKERTSAALPFGLPPLFGNNTVCYDPSAL